MANDVADPVTASRRVALRIQTEVARGLRLDVAFARAAPSLPPRDRAFVHELVFGVARLRGRLDHLLEGAVRGGIERLDAPVLEVLRLGAYQLLEMGGVPAYAALSQAVDQAREVSGRGAGGLVNAVLRSLAAGPIPTSAFPDPDADPVGWLTSWGSHPRWLVERWCSRWSFEDVRALVEADNQPPPLTLSPYSMEATVAVDALRAAGIEADRVGADTGSVELPGGTDVPTALDVVPGVIQDAGAHLVVRYADPPEGARVADLCAAPGGKAVGLAARAGFVVAGDRSARRLGRVRENALRTGARVACVVADATAPPLLGADVVLLDVPCTGTGTFRRHPDGRWRLDAGTLERLANVQSRMLDASAEVVRPGGLLVYSTCSLEPEENALQIRAFLDRRTDYEMEPGTAVDERFLDHSGCLEVLPQETGFDGAFAARMRRRPS